MTRDDAGFTRHGVPPTDDRGYVVGVDDMRTASARWLEVAAPHDGSRD